MEAHKQAEKKALLPKSEATRARILESALTTFRERGFENATMREIAAAAGVALGASYYYFDSKDAIVMAFYQRAQQEMAPALDTILSEAKTLEARLRGLIGHKFQYFYANRALLGALSAHSFSARWKTLRSKFRPTSFAISLVCSGSTRWACSCSGFMTTHPGKPAPRCFSTRL
jgi:AcrR family transcriptional regulator